MDIPSGITLAFSIRAIPDGFGKVTGYRFFWLDDKKNGPWKPFQGEPVGFDVPLPEDFSQGSQDLLIEVKGMRHAISQVRLTVNIVPMTMQRPLLVIDDWEENSPGFNETHGGLPSDAEHDAFWEEMLRDVEGFDAAVDVIEAGGAISLATLADYQSVIWTAEAAYSGETNSLVNNVIGFVDPRIPQSGGNMNPNVLALYMAVGGHVLLAGNQVMCAAINRESFMTPPAFPIIFRYELTGDQSGMYPDSRVGEWYSEDRNGLNGDIYNPPYFAAVDIGGQMSGSCDEFAELEPPRDGIEPIYGNGCLNASSMIYGAPVAFWTRKYENRVPDAGGVAARSAVWGFHPVYFNPGEVKAAIDIVLFDEWQLPRMAPVYRSAERNVSQ